VLLTHTTPCITLSLELKKRGTEKKIVAIQTSNNHTSRYELLSHTTPHHTVHALQPAICNLQPAICKNLPSHTTFN
jgi:hypothetical protein